MFTVAQGFESREFLLLFLSHEILQLTREGFVYQDPS